MSNNFKKIKRQISLTFDDGPDRQYTPKILDLLKRFEVKATFFLVGKKVRKNPDIVMRIFKDGHDIGNHTYNHPISPVFKHRVMEREIKLAGDAIKRITGERPFLFRPTWSPWDINAKKMLNMAGNLGYFPVRWSISSMDWLGIRKVVKYKILARDIREAEILLLHDGAEKSPFLERKTTVELLPEILFALKSKNFLPVKLTELLQI